MVMKSPQTPVSAQSCSPAVANTSVYIAHTLSATAPQFADDNVPQIAGLHAVGLEPMTGIEPAYAAWEAAVLPLNYIGVRRFGRDSDINSKTNAGHHAAARSGLSDLECMFYV